MRKLWLIATFCTGFGGAFAGPSFPPLPDDPVMTLAHDKSTDGGKKKKDDEEKEEDVACLLRAHFTS